MTYLGAHVVPAEFEGDAAAYVDLVRGPMLDACAPHARWVDVFCERGAFSVDEARAVLTAGQARGLIRGSTPASSARARAYCWRPSLARRRRITARS